MNKLFGVAALLAVACMMFASSAGANDQFFWGLTTGESWVDEATDWMDGVVPGDDVDKNDDVYVTNAGLLKISDSNMFAGEISRFDIGGDIIADVGGTNYVGIGNVLQSGGDITLGVNLIVGYDDGAATGTSVYTMTGGSLTQVSTSTTCAIGGRGSSGELYISGGTSDTDTTSITFTDNNGLRVGYGSTGGSGLVTLTDYAYLKIGKYLRLGMGTDVTGTLTMSGDSYAEIINSGSEISYIGREKGSTGILNMSGNAEAVFDTSDALFVGQGTGTTESERATGSINLSDYAIFTANKVFLARGSSSYGTGTLTISDSASFTTNGMMVVGWEGANNIATMTVSGGTAELKDQLCIGRSLSTGTVTLSGTGSISVADYVRLGDNGGTATFNLDGGTLTCDEIFTESSNSTNTATAIATFNFNGGVLQANADNADMIHADIDYTDQTLYVKAGGAIIDSNGFSIGILQPLLSDAVSTGGGLTKTGDGTLTLGGANTYTGDTTVEAGTLSITGNTMLSDTGSLSLASGAVMNLDFTAGLSEIVSGLYLNGVAQAVGTWGATGSGADHIDDTYFSGTGMISVASVQIPGDTNGDNIVNDTDAAVVASHWGQTGVAGGASVGDFNGDGLVNGVDASIMTAHWGDHNEGEGNVPEPSTLVILLAGLASLTCFRCKK